MHHSAACNDRMIAAAIVILAFSSSVAANATPSPDEICLHAAAQRFSVPPSLIRAIIRVEGGRLGQVSHNRNGSFDIGPMQINSLWLSEIERRGGSLELLRDHRCANIHFGTWLLSRELSGLDPARIDREVFWRAIGNYHSRTPPLNRRYAERVWKTWMALQSGPADTEAFSPSSPAPDERRRRSSLR